MIKKYCVLILSFLSASAGFAMGGNQGKVPLFEAHLYFVMSRFYAEAKIILPALRELQHNKRNFSAFCQAMVGLKDINPRTGERRNPFIMKDLITMDTDPSWKAVLLQVRSTLQKPLGNGVKLTDVMHALSSSLRGVDYPVAQSVADGLTAMATIMHSSGTAADLFARYDKKFYSCPLVTDFRRLLEQLALQIHSPLTLSACQDWIERYERQMVTVTMTYQGLMSNGVLKRINGELPTDLHTQEELAETMVKVEGGDVIDEMLARIMMGESPRDIGDDIGARRDAERAASFSPQQPHLGIAQRSTSQGRRKKKNKKRGLQLPVSHDDGTSLDDLQLPHSISMPGLDAQLVDSPSPSPKEDKMLDLDSRAVEDEGAPATALISPRSNLRSTIGLQFPDVFIEEVTPFYLRMLIKEGPNAGSKMTVFNATGAKLEDIDPSIHVEYRPRVQDWHTNIVEALERLRASRNITKQPDQQYQQRIHTMPKILACLRCFALEREFEDARGRSIRTWLHVVSLKGPGKKAKPQDGYVSTGFIPDKYGDKVYHQCFEKRPIEGILGDEGLTDEQRTTLERAFNENEAIA